MCVQGYIYGNGILDLKHKINNKVLVIIIILNLIMFVSSPPDIFTIINTHHFHFFSSIFDKSKLAFLFFPLPNKAAVPFLLFHPPSDVKMVNLNNSE